MCSDRPAGAPSEACLHKCGDLYCEDGIYHFGPEAIRKGQLTWQLESESGEIAASGKLFVLVVDPVKDIEKRPAMQQLLTSARNYVASDRFAPTGTLQLYELDALFDYKKSRRRKLVRTKLSSSY
mgnify:FL=1